MTSLPAIDRFLHGKRIALVGVSGEPKDFSRAVLRELLKHGYEVFPVNPKQRELDGLRVYGRVQDVPGPLDGALLMTTPEVTARVASDCIEARVPRVWMHRGAGVGAVNLDAVRSCEAAQIEVIAGECPLMFLSGTGPHAAHATLRAAFGHYPRAEPQQPRAAPLLGYAVGAWAVSTGVMLLLQLTLSSASISLWLHALIAPLVFHASALDYFRRADAVKPLRAALTFTALAAVLHLTLVAGVLMRSAALLTSVPGTWLPLLLIFLATMVVGTRSVPRYRLQQA
jgi:predicted CoA-binding protein